jgi:CDP-glucose 4,6-dehydratase
MEINFLDFFRGKKVFVTGHTGFKGTWLCKILINSGAIVTGYSLLPPTNPNLFDLCFIKEKMKSIIGDIRDYSFLETVFSEAQPEIVIHLAAQPLVRDSYENPRYTYETNVMGTVNILECIRKTNCVKSFLNVTTDKVYHNNEWLWGYRESDALDGHDPYSNSKSCSELVTHSYLNSFFFEKKIPISTARAGNVIGGGDFARDRIIPDCIRSIEMKKDIIVRNPFSTRPYQSVLDPLFAYLLIVKKQFENGHFAGNYNVGPDESDCISTGKLVDLFCKKWFEKTGHNPKWIDKSADGPHEAIFLKLDCSKIKASLGWKPHWNIETAIEKTVEWTKVYHDHGNISLEMDREIYDFLMIRGEENAISI